MTAVEIILIVAGLVMMVGSFFVTEKLSQKEITQISELSSAEMRRILEKNMVDAEKSVENLVDDVIDRSMEIADRALDKETNLKIQNISEFAQSVMEAIKKNHSEVMFLYGMLNDKQGELQSVTGTIEKLRRELAGLEVEAAEIVEKASEAIQEMYVQASQPVRVEEEVRTEEPQELLQEEDELPNNNQNILELYQQGLAVTDIARQLGLGVGEVRLVIDLYREGKE